MVMHFKNCCCGCSLKTGTVIIGVVGGIFAFIGVIGGIFAVYMHSGGLQKVLLEEMQKKTEENRLDEDQYNHIVKELEKFGSNTFLTVLFVCLVILSSIHLILDIVLVFGASAERPRLVKPWIVFSVLFVVVQPLLSFVNVIINIVNGATIVGVLGIVMLAVDIAVEVYFILVVNSFHKELLSNSFQYKI